MLANQNVSNTRVLHIIACTALVTSYLGDCMYNRQKARSHDTSLLIVVYIDTK